MGASLSSEAFHRFSPAIRFSCLFLLSLDYHFGFPDAYRQSSLVRASFAAPRWADFVWQSRRSSMTARCTEVLATEHRHQLACTDGKAHRWSFHGGRNAAA